MLKSVIIVDDAIFMRNMLKKILVKKGYDVLGAAENGKKALDLYKSKRPDYVIMDLIMPVYDGLQGLKNIRKFDKNAKVIICSEVQNKELLIKVIKSGAMDFIIKPFKIDRLIASLENKK